MWDTVSFKLFVPEEKLARVESLMKELLEKKSEVVKVRMIAKVAGMLGSFTLAMGNVARFYTRGMLSQVAEVVNRDGWESQCIPDSRVIGELTFWETSLRRLNGWRMRASEDVVYCKDGVINMFSDASEFQLAGARIEEGGVSWDTRFKVSLTDAERGSSSTFRELRGITEGLRSQGSVLNKKTK